MECLPQNLKPIVSLAFHSGMRRSEILNPRWKDLDLTEGFIRLEAAATKTRRARCIPLAAEPLAYLRAQKVRRDFTDPACDLVFFRKKQNGKLVQLADFRDSWETACKEAGLEDYCFMI
jgi:integrase